MRRWADAEKDFEAVILQAPRDFNARNNLALALVEQKDDANKQRRALEYARTNFEETRTNQNLQNRQGDALSTLGWVYFCRGEFEQARGPGRVHQGNRRPVEQSGHGYLLGTYPAPFGKRLGSEGTFGENPGDQAAILHEDRRAGAARKSQGRQEA